MARKPTARTPRIDGQSNRLNPENRRFHGSVDPALRQRYHELVREHPGLKGRASELLNVVLGTLVNNGFQMTALQKRRDELARDRERIDAELMAIESQILNEAKKGREKRFVQSLQSLGAGEEESDPVDQAVQEVFAQYATKLNDHRVTDAQRKEWLRGKLTALQTGGLQISTVEEAHELILRWAKKERKSVLTE